MLEQPKAPRDTSAEPQIDPFTQGVRWGLFLAEYTVEHPKADWWRSMVLQEVVYQIDLHPEAALTSLRQVMVDEWERLRCHGVLTPGEVCQECDAYAPEASG